MDAFDRIQPDSPEVKQKFYTNNGKGDAFDRVPDLPTSGAEHVSRSLGSAAIGYASGTPYGLGSNLFQFLAAGELNDPSDTLALQWAAQSAEKPFTDEEWQEATQKVLGVIPTPYNIAQKFEEKIKLPITPKEDYQKDIMMAMLAARAFPGALGQKAVAGVIAPATNTALKNAGVPEFVSEPLAYAASGIAGTQGPKVSYGPAKKHSGMTTRRYEGLKKPTEISANKIAQIENKVETEFKNISDKLITETPIAETYEGLKNDITFKEKASQAFDEVQTLADEIPGTVDTSLVKKEVADLAVKRHSESILPSEADKSYYTHSKGFIQSTSAVPTTVGGLVKSYRKNNKELTELYEPGQSFGYNRGKREALLDYNRAIANVMEKIAPDSELTNLFRSSNEQWTKIMDAEAINNFIDELFKGGIQFKQGKDFFDKNGMTLPFKRALGEEGFKNFHQLMQDLMSLKEPHKMMKVAEKKGFYDLAKNGLTYMLSPNIAYTKLGYDVLKYAYRKAWESLIDKPQLAVTWDKAVKAFKNGDFKTADKEIKVLQGELEAAPKEAEIAPQGETIDVTPEKIKPQKLLENKNPDNPESKPKTTFRTAKGSTYEMHENGATTRNKAERQEHGPNEKGIQPTSEKTYFLSEEDANKLGEFQTQGSGQKRIIEFPDGRLGVMYESGKNAGKVESRTVVKPTDIPQIGYIPVESFEGGKKVHFGNKITQISSEEPKSAEVEGLEHRDRFMNQPKGADQRSYNADKNKKEKAKVPVKQAEKIAEVKKQDVSKTGLKTQKEYLLSEIDNAISNPSNAEFVHFDVPGDGEFKIYNNKQALTKFKDLVEKKWPKQAEKFKPPKGENLVKKGKKTSPQLDKLVAKRDKLVENAQLIKEKYDLEQSRTKRNEDKISELHDKMRQMNKDFSKIMKQISQIEEFRVTD